MGGHTALWFNKFDIGMKACAEMVMANPDCAKCT
jgi:hypothetical protein